MEPWLAAHEPHEVRVDLVFVKREGRELGRHIRPFELRSHDRDGTFPGREFPVDDLTLTETIQLRVVRGCALDGLAQEETLARDPDTGDGVAARRIDRALVEVDSHQLA